MNNWFLYLIRCKNGRLYTGITTDVERRFEEHESGDKKGSKYLRGKTPLELVLKKKVGDRSMAQKIEARIKKMPKIKKELLVDGKIKIREIKKEIWK
ncbi:MAG: GIY-YIG nuclease family protein [Candidatus Scalindua sp.]|jgi:putative endonuclease|nr:GIY-YIG nuclease family protein [Candidatus Scalindua sp.]MDV5165249.1 GIY-YIG nuclease family protein [Candidatus Scalindua sp.]